MWFDLSVVAFAVVALAVLVVRLRSGLPKGSRRWAVLWLGAPAVIPTAGMLMAGDAPAKVALILGAAAAALVAGTAGHPARIVQHFDTPPRKMSTAEQVGVVVAFVLFGMVASAAAVTVYPKHG